MHRGTTEWNDEGLVLNTRSFVQEIVAAVEGVARSENPTGGY